ncbi:MAG: ankyrin repeat domain-containing protein, partial [Halanaerobiales bacterium]
RAGADVHLRERYKGITTLMYAAGNTKNPEIIYSLLNAGADPIARDYQGKRVVDYLNENKDLKGTDAYWKLHYLEPTKTRIPLEEYKDQSRAGLLAAIVPSAGHYYAGNWGKGSLFLFGELTSLAIGLSSEDNSVRNTCLTVFLALKVWEVYDAIQETEKYNQYVEEFNREAALFNERLGLGY